MREFTFKCCLPARNETVIDPEIGSDQRALGSRLQVLDRTEFDFDLAGFRHGRIGAVEWTIGHRLTTPAGQRRSQCRDDSNCLLEAGRKTQIAAGSLDAARTATKSRSSSGTNSDVPAPDTVVTRASRR